MKQGEPHRGSYPRGQGIEVKGSGFEKRMTGAAHDPAESADDAPARQTGGTRKLSRGGSPAEDFLKQRTIRRRQSAGGVEYPFDAASPCSQTRSTVGQDVSGLVHADLP